MDRNSEEENQNSDRDKNKTTGSEEILSKQEEYEMHQENAKLRFTPLYASLRRRIELHTWMSGAPDVDDLDLRNVPPDIIYGFRALLRKYEKIWDRTVDEIKAASHRI